MDVGVGSEEREDDVQMPAAAREVECGRPVRPRLYVFFLSKRCIVGDILL